MLFLRRVVKDQEILDVQKNIDNYIHKVLIFNKNIIKYLEKD